MALFNAHNREIKLWRVAVLFVFVCIVLVSGLWIYNTWNEPRSWQLRSGMTKQEVRSIMGEPDSVLGDQQSEDWWYTGEEHLSLFFHNGRLAGADEKGHPASELPEKEDAGN